MRIRLGTRGSLLARTQSGHVADALRGLGHEVELVIVKTDGDVNMAPLKDLGGVGVFAAALRASLLDGQVDIAVHSYKDLPTAAVPGLLVAAVPQRRSAADVLITRGAGLDELPAGAVVGTGSPRRVAQLLARRPDLRIVDVRGNVDTRLSKVAAGELDALVLAAAGLDRLGNELPEPLDFLPAPAQGALAVECRQSDAELREALSGLEDRPSRFAAEAERAVLARLGAGCAAPVGTASSFAGKEYRLEAGVWSLDGSGCVRAVQVRRWAESNPAELGATLAQELLQAGAGALTDLSANKTRRHAGGCRPRTAQPAPGV